MIYYFIYFILFFSIFISSTPSVHAIYDPLSVPNNKYGIHIIDENDLYNAAKLVNSTGGDWGYVTMVIREDDRNAEKWQKIFLRMKELHLIPLIRLATRLSGDFWDKPHTDDSYDWADFLSQLYWPVKNRYIILFNEPNHAKEWGNTLDPEGYADIISSFSAKLKEKSADFFILPAGLDASAPNSTITMDEVKFLRQMVLYDPEIFDSLDGWTSHSYPNPGFNGKVTARGRGTLSTYLWEKNLLKSFGVDKFLPIFITETGWPHQEGSNRNNWYYPAKQIPPLILQASSQIWSYHDIAAITPFILNYQSFPFSNFSWQKSNSSEFYPQYESYLSLEKIAGFPLFPEISDQKQILGYSDYQATLSTETPINYEEYKWVYLFIQYLVQFISKSV